MTRKQSLILALKVLGSLGALIAFLATVPAETAKTNLASWVTFVGIDRVPDVLQRAQTDIATFSLGFLTSVASVIAVIFLQRRTHRMERDSMRALEEAAEGLKTSVERIPRVKKNHIPPGPGSWMQ